MTVSTSQPPTSELEPARATEADLLATMALQREAPDSARQAWAELYERHVRYIYFVLHRTFASVLPGDDELVDVATRTFQKAYEWAGRQPSSEVVRARFSGSDPNVVRKRVLGWLASIADCLVKDELRSASRRPEELDLLLDEFPEPAQETHTWPTPRIDSVRRCLNELGHDEAVALRASLPWYDPRVRQFVLPSGEAAEIARRLGTTPATLRQRRHRALKRLALMLSAERDSPGREKETP